MSATQLSDSLQVKSQTHNNSKKGPLMCSNGISKTNILHPIAGSYPKLVKAGVMKQSKGEHGVKMR